MKRIVLQDNKSSMLIKPYIGGEEVTNDPCHEHRRFVIDFDDMPVERDPGLPDWQATSEERKRELRIIGVVPADYPFPTASDYPELLKIVESNVKPERSKSKNAEVREFPWWKFWRARNELYKAIEGNTHCLGANAGASPQFSIARLPTGSVFSHALAIFAFATLSPFAVVQSRPHELWARFFASSMKDDLRYTPSDCFETFPFPTGFETSRALESAGEAYHDHRAALMIARNEGMTKTYNRFHDPAERAPPTSSACASCTPKWTAPCCAPTAGATSPTCAHRAEPIFLDETNEDDHTYQGRLFWPSAFRDHVLARLLALNAERHAEEVRLGIAPGMGRTHADHDETEDDREEA